MFKGIAKFAAAATLVVSVATFALAAHAPRAYATNGPSSTCVNGSQRSNLAVAWNTNGNVSFKTMNGKPLCDDVTLFFSSYTMPDNYDGKGFSNNPTASPQTIFDSASYVMKKGTTGASTLSIKLPEACKNIQVDLYYAPEIKTVTAAGHGRQYITGKIISKTVNSCDTTPTTPTTPETPPTVPPQEAQTPETPPAQVTVETPAPTPESLPNTGSNIVLPIAVSALVAVLGYAGSLAVSKRAQ